MTAVLQTMKRLVRPGTHWSLDVDLRYLPVVRRLKNARHSVILEVGSGQTGITPYVGNGVIGCDTTFGGAVDPRLTPVIARAPLPFRDGTFEAVVSLDTLEHVPRDARDAFVRELVRVCKSRLYVGFPEGDGAARHDAIMEEYYRRHQPAVHPYFVEHREYGVPKSGEFTGMLRTAAGELGVHVSVEQQKNVNLTMRAVFMRLIWHRNPVLWRLYFALSAVARWDFLFHFGQCYRMIYAVTIHRPGAEGQADHHGPV